MDSKMSVAKLTHADLSTMLADTRATMEELLASPGSIIDPFKSIYGLVFLLTMRNVGCEEIARDKTLLDTTLDLFETIAHSTAPSLILFPWLPTWSLVKRYVAGVRLYMILNKIVMKRKKSGLREDDTLQYLLDCGDDMSHIIGFVMGVLFAAQQNTGIITSYCLVYLSHGPNKEWAAQIRKEVETATKKYFPDENLPTIEKLAKLPLSAWESEFPIIELCMKDAIRLHSLGATFRKNISGKELAIGPKEEVPAGAFVSYHIGTSHLDPTVYTNPTEWDPARFLPDRAEDKKKHLAWVGWGTGRHPCLGMKFAKLEQSIIAAFFLTMLDSRISDSQGRPVDSTPPVDVNSYTAWKPRDRVFLKLRAREV
jgi:cytochrome P450